MELYFWSSFEVIIHVLCTFFVCCAHRRPERDGCGRLFSRGRTESTSGGDTLGAASLRGRHDDTFCFLGFSVISSGSFRRAFSLVL